MADIILGGGKEKSLHRRHPWIFSGAVQKMIGDPAPGETVGIRSLNGKLLGWGAYSPSSKIRVRVWTFSPEETVSPDFFKDRLARAIARRAPLLSDGACRLVNAEGDGLPGIIVDRYGDWLVAQFLTTGAELWKETIISLLGELVPGRGIYERSDPDARVKEGLPLRVGLLSGEEPPDRVEVREGAYRFLVDIRKGHKTGFYLDQQESRLTLASCASGADILNCFSYTGGFAVAGLAAGAKSVVNVDASADALALAEKNVALNLPGGAASFVLGDVFSILREYRAEGRRFDLIILDPPKFAESRQHLEKAARGYKDINLQAMGLLRPGGLLMTFSCSGLMTRELFERAVAWAALDAGREVRIMKRLFQSADHPELLSFPESNYLKGLLCRVE